MADTRIILTSGSAWTVPADFSDINTIECLGGGASGSRCYSSASAAGGGGGAYAKVSNLSLTPGNSITYSVGVGGTANDTNGEDTWFNGATLGSSSVGAKAGLRGASYYKAGIGGLASSCVGDVKYSGGNGGAGYEGYGLGGGGGGAAGVSGAGGAGGNGGYYTGGIGGTADNGTVAAGTSGTEWDATHGSGGGGDGAENTSRAGKDGALYGAGGGGSGSGNGSNSIGKQGLIVITYTPVVPGSSNFFQLF